MSFCLLLLYCNLNIDPYYMKFSVLLFNYSWSEKPHDSLNSNKRVAHANCHRGTLTNTTGTSLLTCSIMEFYNFCMTATFPSQFLKTVLVFLEVFFNRCQIKKKNKDQCMVFLKVGWCRKMASSTAQGLGCSGRNKEKVPEADHRQEQKW